MGIRGEGTTTNIRVFDYFIDRFFFFISFDSEKKQAASAAFSKFFSGKGKW